jgi:hypothetical protein
MVRASSYLKKTFMRGPRRTVKNLFNPIRKWMRPPDYNDLKKRVDWLTYNHRNMLFQLHSENMGDVDQRTAMRRSEAQMFTEHGEAGVILHIFSKIGVTDKRVIEFGIGDVARSNVTNLALSFGWSGLMMDGSAEKAARARAFFEANGKIDPNKMTCIEAFVTPENINTLFKQNGFEGEIDFLTIDIDGNDYWVWKAIDVIRPRVVMIEYNPSLGAEVDLIMPYDGEKGLWERHALGWYHSASLKAMERIGKQKGYTLIGCESTGLNAFFVLDEVAKGIFEPIRAEDAYYPETRRLRLGTLEEQIEEVMKFPHVTDD